MDENKNQTTFETDEFAGESLYDSVKFISPMSVISI